jgi:hypothetical protein
MRKDWLVKYRRNITIAIFIAIAISWLFILRSSEQSFPIGHDQAGCYSDAERHDTTLTITNDGKLIFSDGVTSVHLRNDKGGLSFETTKRVVFNEESHQLKLTHGYPDLFRINKDGSFYIPTDSNDLILFVRVCDTEEKKIHSVNKTG